MEIMLASGWEWEAWEVEETTEGESAEDQGDVSVPRTPTFNTQVKKKPARERKMEREGGKSGKFGATEAKGREFREGQSAKPWKT